MAAADFWDCQSEAQTTVERLKILKKVVEPWHHADRACADLVEFLDMVDENQIESLKDLAVDVQKVRQEVENLEFQRLFTDPFDPNNAIISINAGAGGTEACDWAQMLFRMYTRYCEQHDQKIQMIDLMEGEGAGIKSATFIAQGPYAYGYLKAESGVHRLVRISPFDANKRRHTSFASVDVIAEVEDTPEVEIKKRISGSTPIARGAPVASMSTRPRARSASRTFRPVSWYNARTNVPRDRIKRSR